MAPRTSPEALGGATPLDSLFGTYVPPDDDPQGALAAFRRLIASGGQAGGSDLGLPTMGGGRALAGEGPAQPGPLAMGAPQGFTPTSLGSIDDSAGFDARFNQAPPGQSFGGSPSTILAMREALSRQGAPGSQRPYSLEATGAADVSARAGMPGASPMSRPMPESRSPDDVSTTGAIREPGAASNTGSPAGGSFLDSWKNLADTGLGDQLLALSSGLLAGRGASGWSAGFENMRKAGQVQSALESQRLETALKTRKLVQEIGGQNQTEQFLIRNGHAPETARGIMAAAAAGDRTALTNALNNIVPKGKEPEPFTLSQGQTRYDATGQPVVGVAPDKPENFDTESKLRGEFAKGLGTFGDVHDGYGRVIAATRQREANPTGISPASDIGLVYGYMKMLDPGSVVREGEYATAQNAAGIPERVRNAYNKAMSGEFLTPEQRQDFVGQANELYGTARKTAEAVSNRYRGLATQYGVDPDRTTYLPEVPVAPKVGRDRMRPDTTRGNGVPQGARRAPDGKLYVPDPNRPGKYLEVR